MKYFSCFIIFIFIGQLFYGADLVVQKIGITIDKKSPNYNIDLILEKIILSVASSNRNVNVYSANKADLEYSGIGVLNGNVLLKSVKKQGYYQIQLYQMNKTEELFDDSIKLVMANFGDTADEIALKVINSIAAKFPPKQAQELTKIDVVKIKLSEYESQNGYWGLTIEPAFNVLSLNIDLKNSSNEASKVFNNYGGGLDVEGIYRIQQWSLAIGCSADIGGWNQASGGHASFNDFYFHGLIAYGFFGSLFIIGLEPYYYRGDFKTDYFLSSVSYPLPNLVIQEAYVSFYIQLNITKDYYIVLSGAPPIAFLNQLTMDFSQNGTQPNTKTVQIPTQNMSSSGPPLIKLKLCFRIAGSWWAYILYDYFNSNYYTGNNYNLNKIYVDPASQISLNNFNYNKTRIGLGIHYDF